MNHELLPLGHPIRTRTFVSDDDNVQLRQADFTGWKFAIYANYDNEALYESPATLAISTALSDTVTKWVNDSVNPGWNFEHTVTYGFAGEFFPIGGDTVRVEYVLYRSNGKHRVFSRWVQFGHERFPTIALDGV